MTEEANPQPPAPSPPKKTYRGKRFLLTYAVVLILVLVVGMWLTWTLAGIMAPRLKARKEERMRQEQADRDKAREQEKREEAILDSRGGIGKTNGQ